MKATAEGDISLRIWLAKNSGPGFSEPMVLPRLPRDRAQVCPARTLLAYLEATKESRAQLTTAGVFKPVFLSTSPPIKGLSAARISVLVRDVLRELGLPVRTYAVRKKATTEALEKGFSIHTVAKGGRWKSLDVLQNHYNRTRDTKKLVSTLLAPTHSPRQ